jgi:two-component system, chemotaxis family, protein-glutamate methylesterase/glutaminase
MPDNAKKIRVVVVDDSAVMRKLISSLLERDKEIEVVATAIDGDFAVSKVEQLKPDVVTLDVDMPRMDGLTALKFLVSKHHIPVVMLSSLTTRGASLTMQALELGAFDFVCKPKGYMNVGSVGEELVLKVKAAAQSRTVILDNSNGSRVNGRKSSQPIEEGKAASKVVTMGASSKVIAIGASSGGPHALRFLLPKLPVDLDAGILIVQHMMESFTGSFARWLNDICEFEVREAEEGDAVMPGRILIAPGNAHMQVKKTASGGEVVLKRTGQVNGHVPSVDMLFQSVAIEYGKYATGLIMTGMGSDGAQGLGEMKKAGAYTIAQDRASCVVYGMPRVAVERGFVDRVIPLAEIASHLVSVIGKRAMREELYVGNR